MRNISQLHPALQLVIPDLMAECEKQGLKIGISECLRTVAEQDALYAKGRTAAGSIVTNAKGSSFSSMHQWGIAFDFYRNDGKGLYDNADGFFDKVGYIGKSLGLEWGGNWKSPKDLPHFQLGYWGSTTSQLKAKYNTPERFFESWGGSMTLIELQKLNTLVDLVSKLTLRVDDLISTIGKVYHYTEELPDWARPTIQKLLDEGRLSGASEDDLNLPEIMVRCLVVQERKAK